MPWCVIESPFKFPAARVQVPKVQDLLRLVRQAFKALQAPGAEPKAPPGGGLDAEVVGAASGMAAATVASFEVRVNALGDNVLHERAVRLAAHWPQLQCHFSAWHQHPRSANFAS